MMATDAEGRARELLRSVAGDEAAEMYGQLGFLHLEDDGGEFGYLIYPHRPIVAYDARSGELLSEYCVRFPTEQLPDADDVLAKWMALRHDQAQILAIANLDRLGTQLDPAMVRRDLATVRAWETA
jgi:hypothetical protein